MATETSVVGGIAERYATALYELAEETRTLDAVADDLRALQDLLRESADLVKLVRSPLIERSAKVRAMAAILESAGAGDLVRRFIGVVAANGRLFALPAMIKAFLAELARRRGEVTAEVISARPMSETQQAALTETLRAVVGGKVAVETSVDPSLLGGLVVRVGSKMFDSSVRSKLQRMQLAMKGAR